MPTFDPTNYVYLDYAASAPLSATAAEAMAPYMEPSAAQLACNMNANSLHAPGRAAYKALEDSRRCVARALKVSRGTDIVFTSGATEADDAALIGLAHAAHDIYARATGGGLGEPHIITTAIEHDAVLAPARRLEREGFRVTYLQPNADGFIEVRALEAALDEQTLLVSVQMANSEVGSIQPIKQLCALTHAQGALFHTDATQALGKVPLDMTDLDVDAASFSAHKIGGPKGVGCLYVRARTPFEPYLLGGGQEEGRRSGTQNVAGIAGFAAAIVDATENVEVNAQHMRGLRDVLYGALCGNPSIQATVDVAPGSQDYLPNIVHVLVEGLESETLILRFDSLGFGVSGGSACSSHSLEPSHVLRALGKTADEAHSALRISFGPATTRADIDAFLQTVPRVLSWNS